jgi:hypothetical protein
MDESKDSVPVAIGGGVVAMTGNEFLDLVLQVANNTCIVARTLLRSFRVGDLDQITLARTYLMTDLELRAIEDAISVEDLKRSFGIIRKVGVIRDLEPKITNMLVKYPGVAEGKSKSEADTSPTVKTARHQFGLLLDEVRRTIIDLQTALSYFIKPNSQLLETTCGRV